MAEFNLPYYCYGSLALVSDLDMIDLLKEIIDEVIVERGICHECGERTKAVEAIYPTIADIIFNPNFSHIRDDKEAAAELITRLVVEFGVKN